MSLTDELKKPTEYKAPGGISIVPPELNTSDFEDSPYIAENTDIGPNKPLENQFSLPGNEPLLDVLPPKEKVFDPDFTTEIAIDTFDTSQHTLFLMLNNKRQKSKRFKNKEEYREAISLSYLTETELKQLENYEEKKILIEKLKDFQSVMEKINDKLQFTQDEKLKIRRPIYELVKRNNFDIPPGLALVLATMDILSDRVIDLIMD